VDQQDMGTVTSLDEVRKRKAAESIVVCLACAAAYEKPGAAGTLAANPGCPGCGYVGWIGVATLGRRGTRIPSPMRPGAFAFQTETRASSSTDV
jgi:hypothetical protein